ncbi:MAG: helix-hairpin-helix domain-containing protein [bacterium]|nr:helix-hairpin-helix domain-containing protein [bacterium]
MKKIAGCAGTLLVAALCVALTADSAAGQTPGLAELGVRGLMEQSLSSGTEAGAAPVLLARRRRRKKTTRTDSYSGVGEGIRLDPNTAKLKELMLLPLVDEPTARAIIAHRPYAEAEDLARVPEVGPQKFRIFKHLIEVRGPADSAAAPGGEPATEEDEEEIS